MDIMSKGTIADCRYCGTPYKKKRERHYFCRTACRVANNRKKKGVPSPAFMGGKEVARKPTPQPKPIMTKEDIAGVEIYPDGARLTMLKNNLAYWEQVRNNALRNRIPISAVGGGIGYVMGDTTGEKLAYGLIGALLGHGVDNSNKTAAQQTVIRAEREIKAIRRKISETRLFNRQSKPIQDYLVEDNGVFKVSPDVLSKVSVEDYRKEDIPSLKFTGSFGYLIGNPGKNFYFVIYGGPGSRKSTFCLRFANYFSSQHGKVLYITREQAGRSKSFQSLLELNNCKGFDIDRGRGTHDKVTLPYLIEKVKGYDLVILDSVNYMKLKPTDIEALRAENDSLAVLAIMQSTKDNQMKGGQEFKHDCDLLIKADGISYQIDGKNRYGDNSTKLAVDGMF